MSTPPEKNVNSASLIIPNLTQKFSTRTPKIANPSRKNVTSTEKINPSRLNPLPRIFLNSPPENFAIPPPQKNNFSTPPDNFSTPPPKISQPPPRKFLTPPPKTSHPPPKISHPPPRKFLNPPPPKISQPSPKKFLNPPPRKFLNPPPPPPENFSSPHENYELWKDNRKQ